MKGRGLALALCLTGLAAAAPASAAEQLGATGNAGNCMANRTYVTAASNGIPDYIASAPGVITSWRAAADGPGVIWQFLVLRPDSGTAPPYGYTPTQADIDRELTVTNGVNTFTGLHIPIAANETIGVVVVDAPGNDGGCLSVRATNGNRFQDLAGAPPLGISSNYSAPGPPGDNVNLNLAATVEPDADGDRFGDETQDQCPTNAALQTACPPTPTTPAKKCKKRKKKSKKGDASAAAKKKKGGCKKGKRKKK
jgi:hypothetical protein